MNPSAAVMLVEDRIRPVKVEYDPDNQYNNKGAQHSQFFKCLDANAKKDDLVIVSTTTRHGMTVAKIVAIGTADVPVNFEGHENWGWVIGPVPTEQHKAILETEKKIVGRVQEANTNKLKSELKAAMGLSAVTFDDLDLSKAGQPVLVAPQAPAPTQQYADDAVREVRVNLDDEIPF